MQWCQRQPFVMADRRSTSLRKYHRSLFSLRCCLHWFFNGEVGGLGMRIGRTTAAGDEPASEHRDADPQIDNAPARVTIPSLRWKHKLIQKCHNPGHKRLVVNSSFSTGRHRQARRQLRELQHPALCSARERIIAIAGIPPSRSSKSATVGILGESYGASGRL